MRPCAVAVLLLLVAGPARAADPLDRGAAPLQPRTVRDGRAARARGGRDPGPRRRRARRPRPHSARAVPPVRRPARARRRARESLRTVDPRAARRPRADRADDRPRRSALPRRSLRRRGASCSSPVRRALGAARRAARTSACSTGGRPRSTGRRSRCRPRSAPAIYARILERMDDGAAPRPGSTAGQLLARGGGARPRRSRARVARGVGRLGARRARPTTAAPRCAPISIGS